MAHYRKVPFPGTAWVVLLLNLASCISSRSPGRPLLIPTGYCDPPISYSLDSAALPLPDIQPLLQAEPRLVRQFSRHDLELANAAGALGLLRDLVQLQSSTTLESRLAYLDKQQQLIKQLLLVSTEVASVAAELDCEGERADQLANYLDVQDDRRVNQLTIWSVVTGAVTTVASTLLNQAAFQKTVGISGGILSAGLGGAAAFSSRKTVHFVHQRNLLTDIWYQREHSAIYPPFVWQVLNDKMFSNSQQYSVLENTRQRWKSYGFLEQDGSQESQRLVDLYFGAGGAYQAQQLHTRANMLNQLQASVRSIDQDLQSMLLALSH